MSSRRRITVALIGLLVLVLGGWLVKDLGSGSGTSGDTGSGMATKALSALPPEAGQTWRLIQRGGPFPYPRNDGVVFDNREKRLPVKQSGYYHEYTVPTPGSSDRGSRRLITGESRELYYTGDHYASFVIVDPTK
ncbi:guanyl-specific ribonuclease Sa [Amycolatopsis bartoniae]|uniref:Ribonuclease N1 n=1 Tax=Amycolatopsis bartoniae TaxID=941986 RepID=A0A8H9MDD6_9PSEU|nr:ribonuclease domain-containing protein [Amycolatopsis bartoniae]MBB2935761.1 guanyl-specific ribonuclease Sa [Amycolatopsis bartoniae]TVT05868.1 ribonuclease N [Amycolatopsis bartoniae]GHF61703.1 ribonuclease N1 [Amycolatopsis bartoniae]